jgi:hypothetical protein
MLARSRTDGAGACQAPLRYFFFEGDPAGWLALANPAGVVAGEAFTLSFFGFLASLLLRI